MSQTIHFYQVSYRCVALAFQLLSPPELSRPPSIAVSSLDQKLKGASSHKLFSEFAHMRKQYWGQHLWGRGYFVATTGTVTDEIIKEYIENQDSGVPDDDFRMGS